jgi:WD40 repeat protein
VSPRPAGDPQPPAPKTTGKSLPDPIVIADCHFTPPDKQEVPAWLVGPNGTATDGKLLFIGYEIPEYKPGARVALIHLGTDNGKEKTKPVYFMPLREGSRVEENQMVAMVDPVLALNQVEVRKAKLSAAKADYEGAVALQDVYAGELSRLDRLRARNFKSVSEQEYAIAVAQKEKYKQEAFSKKEAIKVAERELSEAGTMYELHRLRNAVRSRQKKTGSHKYSIIKQIFKQPGEAVRSGDPVMQILDIGVLRAEGLVDIQHLGGIEEGMTVRVNVSRREEPIKTLPGHRGEINGLAVSSDEKDPLIISASEDKTSRVWRRNLLGEARIWYHPAAVRAVACTPKGSKHNFALTACADGSVRLWDLDTLSDQPLQTREHLSDAINCVAFSPDGTYYATGGEDNSIVLWNTETGKEVYRFDAEKGHQGAVTALHFTPDMQLVSAGRDNSIRIWVLRQRGAELKDDRAITDRSGNVPHLGVSPDGRYMLFDHGKTLQVMTLDKGRTVGGIKDPSESSPFETFATFSPDGQLILTASASESRMQLWRAPTSDQPNSREVMQFAPKDGSPATCAAFGVLSVGPKGPRQTFAVTGTKDGLIYVWVVPSREQYDKEITGVVTLKEKFIEPSTRQTRIWVEVKNEDGELNPGDTVNIVVPRAPLATARK